MIQPVQWPFSELMLGAWLATGVLFCLYNFLIGLVLRQRWLSAIILPGLGFLLIEYLYFTQISVALPMGWNQGIALAYLGCLTVPPVIMATAAFTRGFLQLQRQLPHIEKALRLIGYISLAPLIGLPFLPINWIATAMFIVVMAGAAIASYAHWHIWRAGGIEMRLLGGSWLLMGPALVAWFGRNLGVFEGGPIITGIYLSGFSGNLVLLSVASVARMRERNQQISEALRGARQRNKNAKNLEQTLRDEISSRSRQLDEQKSRADAEYENKRAFMSLVSHDLRGPLANAEQALRRIQNRPQALSNEDDRRLLMRVSETIQHQVALVDRLMDMSSLTHSRAATRKSQVNFAALVDERLTAWRHKAANKDIRLVNRADTGKHLYGDALLISTLIDNLITNAIRHTLPGEQISVQLCDEQHNCFEVSNTHAHLSQAQADRIMRAVAGEPIQPQSRAENLLSNDAEGLGSGRGLGLRLVRSLITAQGGSLEAIVEDSCVIFRIRIPEASPQILLVDDQPLQLEALREQVLAIDPQLEVITAQDAKAAIRRLKEKLPDLIISDIRMPVDDGFALLKQIRRNSHWEEIPVILMSAAASKREEQELATQALRAGADAYINKPMTRDDLSEWIANINTDN